jgi:16S rRNA (guanine(966)-N(2))-methyltransferase RsmD
VRIIAGRFKGKRLVAPDGRDVRPTSDRLRETLFNVLAQDVPGGRILDGFAGTGAIGLEALSRGAASVVFVERDPRALKALDANVQACGVADACAIIRDDFLTARLGIQPSTGINPPFDLVLLDPPYSIDDDEAQRVVERAAALVARTGRVVLEHSRRRSSPDQAGDVMRYRVITAGDSALSFYAVQG